MSQNQDWTLVPIVRGDLKTVDLTLEELVSWVANRGQMRGGNPCEWVFAHDTKNAEGELVSLSLRLCFKARCAIPEAWTCAVVMYGIRIDGIDHHARAVIDIHGKPCVGWHRQGWDPLNRTSERVYECLPAFASEASGNPGDPAKLDTLEALVSRCCDELGFRLKEGGPLNEL